MARFLVIAATCAAAMLLGTSSSQAYGNAPWCAVVSVDRESVVEQCSFKDFESCRQEVVAGNRGYCTDNPRFARTPAPGPKPKARKRARH